jgi:hypothetical protein
MPLMIFHMEMSPDASRCLLSRLGPESNPEPWPLSFEKGCFNKAKLKVKGRKSRKARATSSKINMVRALGAPPRGERNANPVLSLMKFSSDLIIIFL